MTNSQTTPTLKQEIEELERDILRSNKGELDAEEVSGTFEMAVRIVGKLQEIIEMQQQALKVLSDGNDDGYVFESAGEDGDFFYVYADHILEETKQLLGE